MEALWRHGPMTPDGLVAEVGPANGWARNTVRVLITRLLKKAAIRGAKEADGRFLYRPLVERSAYVQAESQGLLDRLFEGKLAPLVAHFAQHRDLTPEDMEKLNALIAEIDNDPR
jgi:predicted transcriptional regulator